MPKQTLSSRLRAITLIVSLLAVVAGCTSHDSTGRATSALLEDGEFCSETVDVSGAIKTVALGNGRVASTVLDADPITGVLRPTTSTYECNCENGTGSCYPTFNGTSLGCTSQTCSTCKLSKVESASGMRAAAATCGGPYSADEDAALAARVDEIAAWTDANRLPTPTIVDGEMVAPDGYELAVEVAGRRDLSYVVPLGVSAPASDGTTPDRLFAPKAKCRCSGSGDCSFVGVVCQGVCTDNCQITIRGHAGD